MATGTVTAGIADRLGSTLFLAALAHGVVILGVTFSTSPFGEPDELPSLNVTLLVDTDTATAPDPDTDLLANTNAIGGGRPDDSFRPTTVLASDHPVSQLGHPLGADLTDGTPREQSLTPEQLASRDAERQIHDSTETTDTPADTSATAAELLHQDAPETLAAELDDAAHSQRSDNATARFSPSTRESVIANYLVGWRRRVERIGTANFPREFLSTRGQFGRPVLEVAIDESGALEDIVVRRSSGDEVLDEAALKILRMAAPFEALPPEIVAEHNVLRFAYEWDFTTGVESEAADRVAAAD